MLFKEDDGSEGTEGEAPATATEGAMGRGADTTLAVTTLAELREDELNLSMHSMVGVTSGKAMKLMGKMGEQEVMVLIDCGATHNFISEAVVAKLGLPVDRNRRFGVVVGDGSRIQGMGFCPSLWLEIQGFTIEQPFYPFGLGGADVILGMTWLESLGEVKTNWGQLWMSFFSNGQAVTLQGKPSLSKTLISIKSLMKTWTEGDDGFVIELGSLNNTTPLTETLPPTIHDIVVLFPEVFVEAVQLPPQREHDHAIILKPDHAIPRLRPYRYPHALKVEIEKMIQDMLAAGFIRPSTSPFASPVLLVKKKDGSWRFCVDYRALNKATVPDKFPIPAVDELMDRVLEIRSPIGVPSDLNKEGDQQKTAF